jgi:rod shape-determining protein MreD
VSFLRVLLALAVALAVQAGLGLLWPESYRFVDVMILPVVWFAIAGSQRAAMLVGCAAGLLQDAWFHLGVFGLNGFKKTLLGWALGGLGSRFDVNRQGGRMLFGAMASLADSLLDMGLRQLLDRQETAVRLTDILIKAVVTGILVAVVFALTDRVRGRRSRRYMA